MGVMPEWIRGAYEQLPVLERQLATEDDPEEQYELAEEIEEAEFAIAEYESEQQWLAATQFTTDTSGSYAIFVRD